MAATEGEFAPQPFDQPHRLCVYPACGTYVQNSQMCKPHIEEALQADPFCSNPNVTTLNPPEGAIAREQNRTEAIPGMFGNCQNQCCDENGHPVQVLNATHCHRCCQFLSQGGQPIPWHRAAPEPPAAAPVPAPREAEPVQVAAPPSNPKKQYELPPVWKMEDNAGNAVLCKGCQNVYVSQVAEVPHEYCWECMGKNGIRDGNLLLKEHLPRQAGPNGQPRGEPAAKKSFIEALKVSMKGALPFGKKADAPPAKKDPKTTA